MRRIPHVLCADGTELKICGICKIPKLSKEFAKAKRTWDGLHHRCLECNRLYNVQWRRDNPGKYKISRKKQKEELTERVFKLYGDECSYCGFDDRRALCIDHVKGDGYIERKQSGNSRLSLLRRVLRNPEKYQLLCANCNLIKAKENNELGSQEHKSISQSQ